MGKKLTNSILFIAVFAAAVVMTIYVGTGCCECFGV